MVHGYKAFNVNWTCRCKQYEVGKTYTEIGDLTLCEHGMHFCERLVDCFKFYRYDPSETKIAEVVAWGNVLCDKRSGKSCTDILEIVKEIPWSDVVDICNTGNHNTGHSNIGDHNTGNWNTGNWNTGNRNTGNCNMGGNNTGNCNTGSWNKGNRNAGNRNMGNWNTGDSNIGDCNTGDWNTGNYNTGDFNIGNRNTGDWNFINNSSGVFNTETEKIRMFNKQSNWTYIDWCDSEACSILWGVPRKSMVEWVYVEDMTDEEKKANPTYKTTGGYMKVYTSEQTAQMWWDDLNSYDKAAIMNLPNFDADAFEKCTGIRV